MIETNIKNLTETQKAILAAATWEPYLTTETLYQAATQVEKTQPIRDRAARASLTWITDDNDPRLRNIGMGANGLIQLYRARTVMQYADGKLAETRVWELVRASANIHQMGNDIEEFGSKAENMALVVHPLIGAAL